MKVIGLLTFLCLQLIRPVMAQDHCPPKGETKTGGNPSVSWTSYMVHTSTGICVERTVKTHGRMFINWPAAEMDKIFVEGIWTTKRCCFEDSNIKDAELEYGVLGSKLHTTVYQGDHESASASITQAGEIVSGNTTLPIKVEATTSSTKDMNCDRPDSKLGDMAKCMHYTVTNFDSPISIEWTGTLAPASDDGVLTAPQHTFVVGPGGKVTLVFLQGPGQAGPTIALRTADGNQKLSDSIQLKDSQLKDSQD